VWLCLLLAVTSCGRDKTAAEKGREEQAKLLADFKLACDALCKKQASCGGDPGGPPGRVMTTCIDACPRAAADDFAKQAMIEASKVCRDTPCDKLADCRKEVQAKLLKGR
jgi:hypothetical protein